MIKSFNLGEMEVFILEKEAKYNVPLCQDQFVIKGINQ
jgi:hypothetical protein